MTVLKFEMSGREFLFDGALEVTADELWALDELGVSESEIVAVLGGDGDRPPSGRVTRVFCALAYLSARRADPSTTWAPFARTIAPATLNVLGVEASGLGAALLADDKPAEEQPEKPKRAPKAKKPQEKVEEPAPA